MNIFAVCALRCAGRSGCELAGEPAFHKAGRGGARRAALGVLLGVVAAAVCVSIAAAGGARDLLGQ